MTAADAKMKNCPNQWPTLLISSSFSIISLCITCFALGYTIGSQSNKSVQK